MRTYQDKPLYPPVNKSSCNPMEDFVVIKPYEDGFILVETSRFAVRAELAAKSLNEHEIKNLRKPDYLWGFVPESSK
jgi:hypothetical protein